MGAGGIGVLVELAGGRLGVGLGEDRDDRQRAGAGQGHQECDDRQGGTAGFMRFALRLGCSS